MHMDKVGCKLVIKGDHPGNTQVFLNDVLLDNVLGICFDLHVEYKRAHTVTIELLVGHIEIQRTNVEIVHIDINNLINKGN